MKRKLNSALYQKCNSFLCKIQLLLNNNINNNRTSLIAENNRIFLETPIANKESDSFGAMVYAEQLYYAVKKGAKFIAIDGEYGTGKSSIINLFKNKTCCNKKEKKKNLFLNINFLNINENLIEKNEEKINHDNKDIESKNSLNNKESIIDKYHRYFVNQVGSNLCKNPYSLEKTFYNNQFSYTTTTLRKNNVYKIIIDKLLVVLVGIVSIYLVYSNFLKSIIMFNDLYEKLSNTMPYILFIMFILIILYGYGFYKPEKTEKSPMLDIDKCKNNLCKVLYNTVPKKCNLYFIIDDLDRITQELQLPIISLFYNEYYNLDNILNGVKIKFIFMIDLTKIDADKGENINSDKLFDYILKVSNNQPVILRNYIEKQINENEILNHIFNKVKNKDYIVGIITNNYNSIRKVKHLFNRIITKYIYLTSKKIETINYSQLVIISILMGFDCVESLNEKINSCINENKKLSNSSMELIIKEAYKNGILDNNYYIYLTNFIDKNSVLNLSEQIIYNVSNKLLSTGDDWKMVYSIMETEKINYSKIYNQIYKYLPNNEKILLLGDKRLYEYIKNNYGLDVDTKDFYKNVNISIKFENYEKYESFLDDNTIFQTLDSSFITYINAEIEEESHELKNFFNEFKELIVNLKNNIKNYDLSKYLDHVTVTREIFDLLLNQKENDISILYIMLADKKISYTSIKSFINIDIIKDICKITDKNLKSKIENYILQNDFTMNLKKYILINENDEFGNVEKVYNTFNSSDEFSLEEKELQNILDKYGYTSTLDKYIIENLSDENFETDMIEYLKNKEYNLSIDILDKINSLKNKYGYSSYYEKLFKSKEHYELLLYSNLINNEKISIDPDLSNNRKYIDAIKNVYIQIENDFKKCTYSPGITNKIVNYFDFSQINYNNTNFWKIDILIPSLKDYTKCINLFNRLKNCNVLNDYISHCRSEEIFDCTFFENMRSYAQEMRLSSGIKSNITKLINKNDIATKKLHTLKNDMFRNNL